MQINNLINIIKLPFRKEKELYCSLRSIMGFYPHNISYYKLAFMHKSVSRHNGSNGAVNNERLEFLGDAVLGAVVSDIVFRHFKGKREGFLTNTKSKIVKRETLNKLAAETGIEQLIKCNEKTHTHNKYMGGNAFEAFVGAIYLDLGYDACMRFIEKRILSHLINIDKVAYKEMNFKSKLLEWSQRHKVELDFRLMSQERDEHNSPIFQYMVVIEGIECCDGKGYSKKESQQTASRKTMQRIRKDPKFAEKILAEKARRNTLIDEVNP